MPPKFTPLVILFLISLSPWVGAEEVIDIDSLAPVTSAGNEEVPSSSGEAVEVSPSVRAIDPSAIQIQFGQVQADNDVAVVDKNGNSLSEDDAEFLGMEDKITVNFPDEEIRVILRSVADLYGLNIIIPDTLVGRSSIKLRDVTWKRVFDVVLKPVGFTYTEDRNVIEVLSVAQLNLEPQQVRTFSIKYAKAAEVAESISNIVEGTIRVDNRSNSLVVKDRPSILSQVERLLNESTLDRPTLQVMIQTKFIEIQDAIGKLAGADNDGAGVDWWGAGAPFGNSKAFLNWTLDAALNLFRAPGAGVNQFRTAVFSAPMYNFLIRLLETSNRGNLLASPTVVVLNNEQTELHVGRKQPIIEANFDQTTGNFTVGSVDYLPIGVRLKVTPRVNAGAEQITLDINPIVSRIIGDVEFFAQGQQEDNQATAAVIKYPIEAIRETKTIVNIRNGYTLAIGGLTQEDDIVKVEKVPFLGDLPYVGRIFQRHTKNSEKIDLIMFLTASVLNPDGSTYKDVVDPRLIERMAITSSDIPGYESKVEVPGLDRMTDDERDFLEQLQVMRDQFMRGKAMCEVQAQMPVTSAPLTESGWSLASRSPYRPLNPEVVRVPQKRVDLPFLGSSSESVTYNDCAKESKPARVVRRGF